MLDLATQLAAAKSGPDVWNVISALARIKSERAVDVMTQKIQDQYPQNQIAFFKALLEIDTPTAWAAVKSACQIRNLIPETWSLASRQQQIELLSLLDRLAGFISPQDLIAVLFNTRDHGESIELCRLLAVNHVDAVEAVRAASHALRAPLDASKWVNESRLRFIDDNERWTIQQIQKFQLLRKPAR